MFNSCGKNYWPAFNVAKKRWLSVIVRHARTLTHAVLFPFPSSPIVVNENVSLVISRQLLTDFCTHLPNLPDSTAKAIYHFTLEKIQPRVISFEEQVSVVLSIIIIIIIFIVIMGSIRPQWKVVGKDGDHVVFDSSCSQVASIRQHLATIYEKEGDWRNAAQVLVGIPLETGQK